MRRRIGTVIGIAVAALSVAVPAHAELTRDSYRAAVEPICKRDREAAQRILSGVQRNINRDRLVPAGRQLVRAARRFGITIGRLGRVERPPADVAKLRRWVGFLRLVERRTRRTGQLLLAGQKVRANHVMIRAEKSANAANNVSFAFGFRYCRLDRSRFS